MAGAADDRAGERNLLMNRLLDAVKQCQVRFGGKRELATDADSCVTCLCSAWEATLQHGLRHNKKGLSAFKQMTEMTGLTGVLTDIKNLETEPVFWEFVREHLTAHEHERYLHLRLIHTEAGRGRAWLRSALNETSLEKYMHSLISNDQLLAQFYEDGAFLRDQECSSMLPMMAAGLTSILFAIRIDDADLNAIRRAQGLDLALSPVVEGVAEQADRDMAVVTADTSATDKRTKKKRRKAALVAFDEDAKLRSVKKPDLPPIQNLTLSEQLVIDKDAREPDHENDVLSQKSSSLTNLYSESDVFDSPKFERREKRMTKEDSFSDNTSVYTSAPTSPCSLTNQSTFNQYDVTMTSTAMTSQSVPLPQPMMATRVSPPLGRKSSYLTSIQDSLAVTSPSERVRKTSSTLSETSRTSLTSLDSENIPPAPEPLRLVPVANADMDISLYTEGAEDAASLDSRDSREARDSRDAAQTTFYSGYTRDELESQCGLRTAGDGSHAPDRVTPPPSVSDIKAPDPSISSTDLRQAVVAMMMRKDEVEEQNRSLRTMLDQQIEISSGLRAELDQVLANHKLTDEAAQSQITTLTRDNELLKHQLRKYVNAVQLLRREGISAESKTGIHLDEVQPEVPERKTGVDYSHEASEYEKKLIQVAEMHGELMEFNERLHIALNAKEQLVDQLRYQLEQLRGPLPAMAGTSGQGGAPEAQEARPLINIWIPSVFYSGSSTDAHHAYQVYTRIGDEEWNVYCRYQQFHDMHVKLKKTYPIISTLEFPKKKVIGNKDRRFVEERRKKLQSYVRAVVNVVLTHDSQLVHSVSKDSLLLAMPLLSDAPPEKKKRGWRKQKKTATPATPTPPTTSPASLTRHDSTPALYTGL